MIRLIGDAGNDAVEWQRARSVPKSVGRNDLYKTGARRRFGIL